jgi:pyruvate formate lyase activating enzyme
MNDPLQNSGVIFDLKKYAIHDGPGIRTTVFFKGCPLHCWWCHNPEGRSPDPEAMDKGGGGWERGYMGDPGGKGMIGYEITVGELVREIEKDRIFYDQSGGGVTCSGGEPLMQIDFLAGLLEISRERGIGTAVDTSGYVPWERFERVIGLVDLFLYDIKMMDDSLHEKYTGVSNRLILDNVEKLHGEGVEILPRIPLIPDITDTDENLDAIICFLAGLDGIRDVSLLPYNKIAEDKFRRFGLTSRLGSLSMQTEAELTAIGKRFEESGYRARFGG